MNKTLKWILSIAGGLLIAAGLVWLGISVGKTLADQQSAISDRGSVPNYGYGPGMMGGDWAWEQFGNNPGSDEDGQSTGEGDDQRRSGSYPYPYGSGMMSGGMMGGYSSGLSDVEPLSVEEAQHAIEDYLSALGAEDLEIREVMIFDNHAYGLIVEKSTGIGAMEVLVDPVTLTVYSEYGPNMMWNLKYSPMGSGMMGGGMMGGWRNAPASTSEMSVTEEAAIEAAQQYLDAYLPGTEADHHAAAFYGYYTLHVLRDGQQAGMLSVNGYTGEVFLHIWHGDFIEMTQE